MSENIDVNCQECEHKLFELDGEYFCPYCDSISGFELTPEKETFEL